MYRFLGGVNQLDRGFEGLSRAQQSIATRVSQHNIEPTGENTPQTVSRHPNLNGTVGRVPPGATGAGRFDGNGLLIAQNC